MSTEVVFRIDGWTPNTLPMERLGQYLLELAELYGEKANVHFRTVRKGSAVLVSTIDEQSVLKVSQRIARARSLDAPKELWGAFSRIDQMLADDNSRGTLRLKSRENNILAFPGRDREKPLDFGAVRQQGFVDGEIIRIGGKDKSVYLQVQDGETVYSNIATDRETARQLGPLIFGPVVRLYGTGSWRRGVDGLWAMESFRVSTFERLSDDENLVDVIHQLQSIEGSHWHKDDDPIASLLALRHGTAPTGGGRK